MNIICKKCGAYFWHNEKLRKSSSRLPEFGMCCKSGRIQLPDLEEPPKLIKQLLSETNDKAKVLKFLAFSSLDSVYHYIGSLTPEKNLNRKFAQIYFYDTDNELTNRMHLAAKNINEFHNSYDPLHWSNGQSGYSVNINQLTNNKISCKD